MVDTGVRRNEEAWKALYAEGKNDLKYPSDVLVRIGYKCLDPEGDQRILDYGFGTGANLIHFAKLGYDLSGVELSNDAINKTEARLLEAGLNADLRLCSPRDPLPFESAAFDVVIAWQVLYYNTWASLSDAVGELERVLRPGGLLIAAFAAPGDISYQSADALGDSVYRSRVPGQEGCVMVIPEASELQRFFPGRSLEIGEFGHNFSGQTVHHWIVMYRKD